MVSAGEITRLKAERRAACYDTGETEAMVGGENWREERDRLVQLLEGIESGKVTHIDEADLRELQATTPENIEVLKKRIAELNARLG